MSLDVVDAAEFTRAADQSTWWLFHHSRMSMDISPTQFAGLQAHAEYYARAMFEDTSRTLAEDPAKPLRTKDPSWSPLVDFERIDLDGGPAVRSVHRMVCRAGREMMMGHLLVPLEDGLFEARVLTVDMRTGYRESALMLQFAEQDNAPPGLPGAQHRVRHPRGHLGHRAGTRGTVPARAAADAQNPALQRRIGEASWDSTNSNGPSSPRHQKCVFVADSACLHRRLSHQPSRWGHSPHLASRLRR